MEVCYLSFYRFDDLGKESFAIELFLAYNNTLIKRLLIRGVIRRNK